MRENVLVARRLQRRPHDELVDPVRLETVEIARKSGALTPAAHTTSSAGMISPLASLHPFRQHLGDARARAHADAEVFQQLAGRIGQPFRQRRQHAIGRLDDDEPHVLVGIDSIEAVRHERARRVVQLGGKLDAGRAGTDDRDVQLLGTQRLGLRVRAHVRVDEPAMKPLGLDGISSAIAYSCTPGVPKSFVRLPIADDERVVGEPRAEARHDRRPRR